MCGFPRVQNSNVSPVESENLEAYINRLQLLVSDTRNTYWISHTTKHFCHYGPHPCYICPIMEGLENALDNYRDFIKIIGKKHHIIFKKGHWLLYGNKPIRKPLRLHQ